MSQVQECVDIIHQHTKGFKPQIGLILGSGLGQFCDNMKIEASLDFNDLPGFPVAGVGGHAGKLLFGEIKEVSWEGLRVKILPLKYAKLFYEKIGRLEKVKLIETHFKSKSL